MRALASIIGCAWGVLAALSGCVEPPQRAETFGVRVVPDGSTWVVRWLGPGPVVIDGVPRVTWPVRLRDDVPHVVAGRVIPPRIADLAAPVRFVVLGDGRASTDGVGPSAYWPGLLNEALARVPAFILNTGDLVKNGNDRAEWDRYLESLPIWPPMPNVRVCLKTCLTRCAARQPICARFWRFRPKERPRRRNSTQPCVKKPKA